ncbi:hypothetical protein CPB86DRAFT_853393 [Serendipita vermifera]|nr:hypothetical protein CPB86DRAFT_853393 [Serendipita vermifera]
MTEPADVSGTPVSRKRKGLDSSPFGDFSPIGFDELEALNMLEAKFTQMRSPSSKKRRRTDSPVENVETRHPAAHALEKAMAADTSVSEKKSNKPAVLINSGNKETQLEDEFDEYDDEFGPDDLAAVDSKLDSWFNPAPDVAPTFVSFVRPSADPSTGALKVIQPSAAALKAAQKLMAEVDAEEEKEAAKSASTNPLPPKPTGPRVSLPVSKPVVTQRPSSSQPTVQMTPAPKRTVPVAPIAAPLTTNDTASSSRTSNLETPIVRPASTALSEEKSRDTTEAAPIAGVDSPTPKHLGMRARPRGHTKAKFATPWKQGVKPTPTSSVLQLHNEQTRKPDRPPVKTFPQETTPKEIPRLPHSVFNLNPPKTRQKLFEFVIPRTRSLNELSKQGLPPVIGDLDTWNALYWAFQEGDVQKDVNVAFQELKIRGCSLIEKTWVENHWVLILWKLANSVVLWPSSQAERWTFQEVITQLLYRYEREVNRCQRPAIRLIQERDASPTSAMILCVFDITWSKGKDGQTATELVLTDGWYKIRAILDSALARAVKKRKIRVGSKLEVVGAKLNAQRKDADEVLKSFSSSSIIISGNSTHLSPWYSKLGFKSQPSLATLNSLTSDGGTVSLMILTVIEALPVTYTETLPGKDRVHRDESEEQNERRAWQARRSDEESRLREEFAKNLERIEGFLARLESIAGSLSTKVTEGKYSMPDNIEDLVIELEESEDPKALLRSQIPQTAAWMSLLLKDRCNKQRENMAFEIESELAASFPPRNVKSARVLRVKDACTNKKPALRTAQITVWDAAELGIPIVQGKTYMVANLVPNIPNAWGKTIDGELFLSTRRDTRWKRVTLP